MLIVYDGRATLEPIDVVLVIVGPVIAICTTHVFSGSLVQLVELGRWPTMREWLVMARFESRFLLLAVPPLVVLLVLRLAMSRSSSVRVVIWLGRVRSDSAGLQAGTTACAEALVVSILAGLVISGVVLLLKVVLQPGRAGL